MCRPVTCKVCGKTTWAGCGQHVEMVRAAVPAGNWCSGKHGDAERAAARQERPGFFARLFGR
nr:hypothetical protein [Gulosibacter hominis]